VGPLTINPLGKRKGKTKDSTIHCTPACINTHQNSKTEVALGHGDVGKGKEMEKKTCLAEHFFKRLRSCRETAPHSLAHQKLKG